MGITNVNSERPICIGNPRENEDVNVNVNTATPIVSAPTNVNTKKEFLEELGTSLQKHLKTLNEGLYHPSSDNFLSRKLSANRFLNEFRGVKTLKLNNSELVLLEQTESALISTVSSNSLLITALSSSTNQTNSISDRDICDKIRDLMDNVNDEYLSIFETAVEKQAQYWRTFTTVQSQLGKFTEASGSNIKLHVQDFMAAIEQAGLLAQENDDNVIMSGFDSIEKAKEWAAALGLPDTCVAQRRGEGSYVILTDMEPVRQIYYDLQDLTSKESITMNPAKYQAWLTGFNAQADNVKTTCQTVTTKYSSANSLYDTIIKLLTSTITTMTESAKEYLKF
uniref:IpaD/SipD/SspD family type III secretion system needle tip protein n=1 Tax=Yersinia frederiksenii TaxID=29484 RepID=UPI001F4C27C7|nr:IpaD/SipD/SspD family type III secretion system needle tip protein [Yersinia frederiksenii]ULG19777.1 hypothetical protein 49p1_00059 [Yersinia frederiksenii]